MDPGAWRGGRRAQEERRIRAWLAEQGRDHPGPITVAELAEFERTHVVRSF